MKSEILAKKYVAYYRVSTSRQGEKHSLTYQKKEISAYIDQQTGTLLKEFQDMESGAKSNREGLLNALEECKRNNATLIVSKLDRLSRDLEFIAKLQKGKVKFVCLDIPEANEVTIGIMAVLAQYERNRISQRVREGMSIAKDKGVRFGTRNPSNLKAILKGREKSNHYSNSFSINIYETYLREWIEEGLSQRKMAVRLNNYGVKTIRGKTWSHAQIQRVIASV